MATQLIVISFARANHLPFRRL